MNLIKKLFKLFSYETKAPKTFGIFHFLSAAIIALATAKISKSAPGDGEKRERRIALITWIILLAFEIYKQLILSFELIDDSFILEYPWHIFPFQLCSMPLYVLPFIAFLPSGKLREAFVAFYGSYILLGGAAVCIYPGNVFVDTLGISIQTMVWHGSQVALGFYFNIRRFAREPELTPLHQIKASLPLFLCSVSIATIMNVGVQKALDAAGIVAEFNMFYISPYHECMFPILDTIGKYAPFPIFILAYISVLTLGAYLILLTFQSAVKKKLAKREQEEYIPAQ